MTVQTWLVEIPRDECEDLLASSALGRIGVIVDGHPEIFPVNHVYDRRSRSVVFPTNARTKLHGALAWPWVAYEVDGVDPHRDVGWSVMVVGRAEEVTDPEEIDRLAAERDVLWRPAGRVHWVRVLPSSVTGRRISAVDR